MAGNPHDPAMIPHTESSGHPSHCVSTGKGVTWGEGGRGRKTEMIQQETPQKSAMHHHALNMPPQCGALRLRHLPKAADRPMNVSFSFKLLN